MTNAHTSSKRTVILSFVLFLAVLLGLFSIQMKGALDGFDRWVGHEDHRLPNILQVSSSCRWPVLNRFMDLQPLENADAFMFGDSQIFARGATQDELFYTHWLGSDSIVINFSYFGGPIGDMHQIAEELERRGHKAKWSYTALNLTHFTTSLYAPSAGETPSKSHGILPEKPNALNLLVSNRYVCAFKYRNDFSNDQLRTPRYRKLTGDFKKVSLPEGYVDFKEKKFNYITRYYFADYPKIADKMVVASAPIAYDKFPSYGYDESKIKAYNVAYRKLCDTLKQPLLCFDMITKITSDGFGDLIHLNARGQKTLGEKLKQSFP